MRKILTMGRYTRLKFNTKIYKIPISINGFTCPNIDGTTTKGGCSFCQNDSFSPNIEKNKIKRFKLNPNKENPYLHLQLEQLQHQFQTTKTKLQKKFKASKFIVYFQSFTNTYAPFETLKALYEKALSFDDVVGLSIGTRTDSITDEILQYLQTLQSKPIDDYATTEIWLEYGIQSFYDETLSKINRGHNVANMIKWIEKTKKANLKICGHLIYGLPDESKEMMLKNNQKLIDLELDSVKYHPLYVVKQTALTKDYQFGFFKPITENDYIDLIVQSLKMLPNNVIVQRVTAGIDDKTLLAPKWCKIKHIQINNIKKALLKEGLEY